MAQEGALPSVPPRAKATASLFIKGSDLAGEQRFFLGGGVGLVFGGRLTLGGAGMATTESVELGDSGFNLDMGYGGLTLRYWYPWRSGFTWEAGLLLGAGHANVRSLVTGTEVGSDNFAVMEPELGVSLTPLPWFHIGFSGGYRMAWGVEDLPRVAVDDLRSYTASLTFRVGGG